MDNKNIKQIHANVEELKKTSAFPSKESFKKGSIVVIECDEGIPCNPCETICPNKVIKVGYPITNLPRITNENLCNGCGKCIVNCPGLAIFIVDKTFSKSEATVSIPYELFPLPKKNSKIIGLDRQGKEVCKGRINKILSGKALNKTNIVTIIIPKEFADYVRFFKEDV